MAWESLLPFLETFIPFNKVDKQHAYLEGEGDLSLAYWRRVHEAFHGELPVVCETSSVVYC